MSIYACTSPKQTLYGGEGCKFNAKQNKCKVSQDFGDASRIVKALSMYSFLTLSFP